MLSNSSPLLVKILISLTLVPPIFVRSLVPVINIDFAFSVFNLKRLFLDQFSSSRVHSQSLEAWCPQISKGFVPWLDGFWHFNKVSILFYSIHSPEVPSVSWFHGFCGFMVSCFHGFRGFMSFVVSRVLWVHRLHGFHGFKGFVVFMVSYVSNLVSKALWFHRIWEIIGFVVLHGFVVSCVLGFKRMVVS